MAPADTLDIEAVVAACYRVLLRRDPDAAGLAGHVAAVRGGRDIEQTLALFIDCPEFKSMVSKSCVDGPAHAIADHSQCGEVGLLLRHWINRDARHRIVVDVGARGRERSNSFDLLRDFGWAGLLIEANPALVDSITAEFAGLRCQLLCCAISDHDGEATLHIGSNDDVSSLDRTAAAGWGDIRGSVAVPVRRLPPLLAAHGIPHDFDLLSLDIEGEDLRVMNDLIVNSLYRPGTVIIEASHDFSVRSLDDLDLSAEVRASYRIVGQTAPNLILARTG